MARAWRRGKRSAAPWSENRRVSWVTETISDARALLDSAPVDDLDRAATSAFLGKLEAGGGELLKLGESRVKRVADEWLFSLNSFGESEAESRARLRYLREVAGLEELLTASGVAAEHVVRDAEEREADWQALRGVFLEAGQFALKTGLPFLLRALRSA